MPIEVWAQGNGVMLEVRPRQPNIEPYRTPEPLSPVDTIAKANELGIHSQDFWDAVVDAGLLEAFRQK